MKKAFTMIELIFIIVIIGILVVIALPRLTATRTDAKVAVILAHLRQVTIDASVYYAARGKKEWIKASVDSITNVPLFKDAQCKEEVDSNTTFLTNTLYICDKKRNIIKLDANRTHLVISRGDSNSSVAKSVYNSKVFKSLNYSHGIRLGGISIVK